MRMPDETYTSPFTKPTLPRLLRQLAVSAHGEDGSGGGALTIRAVPMSLAAPDGAARRLVDALISALS
jgi:hypothetical protein